MDEWMNEWMDGRMDGSMADCNGFTLLTLNLSC